MEFLWIVNSLTIKLSPTLIFCFPLIFFFFNLSGLKCLDPVCRVYSVLKDQIQIRSCALKIRVTEHPAEALKLHRDDGNLRGHNCEAAL